MGLPASRLTHLHVSLILETYDYIYPQQEASYATWRCVGLSNYYALITFSVIPLHGLIGT